MAVTKQTKRKAKDTRRLPLATFTVTAPTPESEIITIDNEEPVEMSKKTLDKGEMGAKSLTAGEKTATQEDTSTAMARRPLWEAGTHSEDQPVAKGDTLATPGEKR